MNKKKLFSILLSAIIIIASRLCHGIWWLTSEWITALWLTISMVILIASDALPLLYITLLCVILWPVLWLTDGLGWITEFYSTNLFLFTTLAITLGIAFSNTTLVRRILSSLLKRVKNDWKWPMIALWTTAAILSSVVWNVAVVTLIAALCQEYLWLFDDSKVKNKNWACLFLWLAASALLWWNFTPLGTPGNIVMINIAKSFGISISFTQWIIVAIPVTIILLILMAIILLSIFKPTKIDEKNYEKYIKMNVVSEKLVRKEKVLIISICLLILFSIFGSKIWIQADTALCVMSIILMIPSFKLVPLDQFEKSGALSLWLFAWVFVWLGSILTATWAVDIIVTWLQTVFPSAPSIMLLTAIFAIIVVIFSDIIPPAAAIALVAAPIFTLTQKYGIDPTIMVILIAMAWWTSMILPLDPVTVIAYKYNYFSVKDMVKVWLLIALSIVVVVTITIWIIS